VNRVPTLEQGRIVWVELSSPDRAKTKRRPAVIVTSTNEIEAGQPFIVVAATTKFTEPLPDDHVLLPWHPQGKVRTRLRQATVAVCSWFSEIKESDILHYGGVIPPKTMEEILRIVNRKTTK
jgi:mRNA-degrading endonuclease toxin of MazEF toxin-antitoxin module